MCHFAFSTMSPFTFNTLWRSIFKSSNEIHYHKHYEKKQWTTFLWMVTHQTVMQHLAYKIFCVFFFVLFIHKFNGEKKQKQKQKSKCNSSLSPHWWTIIKIVEKEWTHYFACLLWSQNKSSLESKDIPLNDCGNFKSSNASIIWVMD